MSTTSGPVLAHGGDRSLTVDGLPDHGDVGLADEERARTGSPHRPAVGEQRAAEERDALSHPDQSVATFADAQRDSRGVVADPQLHRVVP